MQTPNIFMYDILRSKFVVVISSTHVISRSQNGIVVTTSAMMCGIHHHFFSIYLYHKPNTISTFFVTRRYSFKINKTKSLRIGK